MSIKRILKTKKCQRFIFLLKNITDSRQQWKIKHKQYSIIFIILLAMLAGCNKFKEYYWFAVHHKNRLAKFIELPNGIPSHDTMERTMHRIRSSELNDMIVSLVEQYIGDDVIHICIDGKFARATRDSSSNNTIDAFDIVSAYIAGLHLSIYSKQTKTNDKNKNELAVIKELLVSLKESFPNAKFVITIDAIAAVNSILSMIVSYGWDYIICIKNKGKYNGGFAREIEEEFYLNEKNKAFVVSDKKGKNGRIETRKYTTIKNVSNLPSIDKWATVKGIGKLETTMVNKKSNTKNHEIRYFIFSTCYGNEKFAKYQRTHWQIESFHYVLDYSFNEDHMRMKKGSSPLNTNLLRKFVYNVISVSLAADPYKSYTGFRDSHRLSTPQELLYIILDVIGSPKKLEF